MEIWADKLAERHEFDLRIKSVFFENFEEMMDSLKKNMIDVVTLSTYQYLTVRESMQLIPKYVTIQGDKPLERLLLLIKKGVSINSLKDLKGGKLYLQTGSSSDISRAWLDIILDRQGLPKAKNFLAVLEEKENTSRVMLPVFFEQCDACIVRESAITTIMELNPQVGKFLVVLHSSEALLDGVACFRFGVKEKLIEKATQAALDLPSNPEGQQILILFKLNSVVLFEENMIFSTEKIIKEYESLNLLQPSQEE